MVVMIIQPVKPITASTQILAPVITEGQKHAKIAELAHLVVKRREKRQNRKETPYEALARGKQNESSEELEENATENLNKLMRLIKLMEHSNKKIEFAVNDKTQRIMVKVINADSGKVMNEFPLEKMLGLYSSLADAVGIAIDEKI
jgi:flagellar protein FlaG